LLMPADPIPPRTAINTGGQPVTHPDQRSAAGLVSQDPTCDLGERCTAGNRYKPLGSDGIWTKRGPGWRFDPVTAQSVVDVTGAYSDAAWNRAWRRRGGFGPAASTLRSSATNRTRDRRGPPERQAQAHPAGAARGDARRAGRGGLLARQCSQPRFDPYAILGEWAGPPEGTATRGSSSRPRTPSGHASTCLRPKVSIQSHRFDPDRTGCQDRSDVSGDRGGTR
jgi:hypothetical protein